MAFDAFLQLEGVKGESKDFKYGEWIEVLAVSWGLDNPTTVTSGGGAGAGKVTVRELSLQKWMDKSTPDLIQKACAGQHYPSAKLVLRKASGDKPLEYLVVELKDVFVSGLHWSGSGGGDDRPIEDLQLACGQFEVTYTEQDAAGMPAGTFMAGYSVKENVLV